MSRVIKFRAWDKELKLMMEPSYFGIDEYITPEGCVVEKETHSGFGFSDMYMVDISDKRILMQFTGLHDKNGVEIYEGDVVQGSHRNQRDDELIFIEQEVRFHNGCYMFGNWNAHEYFNQHQHIEVIGNIYEHPHLLEDNKK